MTLDAARVTEAFEKSRARLWGLGYRLTGSAADADDLVQETFVRTLERPPARADEPLEPWLVRVAVNLGLDVLRKRRRGGYVGPWLPSPVDADPAADVLAATPDPAGDASARYAMTEAASYAFLVALEALTPKQRAVLLLRDVFDYDGAETAKVLDISEADVRTTLHRARRAMASYDQARLQPAREVAARTRRALDEFMRLLQARDAAGLEALLAADVRAVGDGGGVYAAGLNPILGAPAVTRLYLSLFAATADRMRAVETRTVNGLPALVLEMDPGRPTDAPRGVLTLELDGDGRIAALYNVVAPRKLTHVRPATS